MGRIRSIRGSNPLIAMSLPRIAKGERRREAERERRSTLCDPITRRVRGTVNESGGTDRADWRSLAGGPNPRNPLPASRSTESVAESPSRSPSWSPSLGARVGSANGSESAQGGLTAFTLRPAATSPAPRPASRPPPCTSRTARGRSSSIDGRTPSAPRARWRDRPSRP